MYKKIEKCRICGNRELHPVLNLGTQMLTGVFPRELSAKITAGPLVLVKCLGEESCGLLQLQHSYDLSEMYGNNYGYRSGLNDSMVRHLNQKVKKITGMIKLAEGDLIIDIGSNDATTLRAYPENLQLVGVDPSGTKFKHFYPPHVDLIADFFSAEKLRQHLGTKKAKVVTSFSMFYDLESPMDFMRQVMVSLADDGIWVFEQSYMPQMLKMNSYDTVCHEHLEFYGLHQIKWMTERIGFKILDVEFNDVNGGSFSVTVAKTTADYPVSPGIKQILENEHALGLHTLLPYQAFAERVEKSRADLKEYISNARSEGQLVAAIGASTKGNVLLQYCGFTEKDIQFVGEVNEEKFGCYTPGSWIPIIPEDQLLAKNPDLLLILPWHFKDFFSGNPKFKSYKKLSPLPILELY